MLHVCLSVNKTKSIANQIRCVCCVAVEIGQFCYTLYHGLLVPVNKCAYIM